MPSIRRISDFKPLFTNLAQTSHFQVSFGQLPPPLRKYLGSKGVDARFIAEDVGLLCYSASLPTTQFATAEITGNFMGVKERFAHTRMFDQITLEFYVDKNYKTIKFLEHWMEFISSGNDKSGVSKTKLNYSYRMQYPDDYKASAKIIKFERDYQNELEYNFLNLFPLAMSSIAVSYNSSDKLTASASFSYERYVAGRILSLDTQKYQDNNNDPTKNPNNSIDGAKTLSQYTSDLVASQKISLSNSNFDAPINNITTKAFDKSFRIF